MTAKKPANAADPPPRAAYDPYPPGTDAAWAELHEIERGAGLEPTRIPPPPFNPDYNLITYAYGRWTDWLWLVVLVGVVVITLTSVILVGP